MLDLIAWQLTIYCTSPSDEVKHLWVSGYLAWSLLNSPLYHKKFMLRNGMSFASMESKDICTDIPRSSKNSSNSSFWSCKCKKKKVVQVWSNLSQSKNVYFKILRKKKITQKILFLFKDSHYLFLPIFPQSAFSAIVNPFYISPLTFLSCHQSFAFKQICYIILNDWLKLWI